MDRLPYLTNCIGSDGPSVRDMVDRAVQVSLATFRRRCESRQWERDMGYGPWLTLGRDWHVRFYRSVFRGRPCYFAVHSAVEHIFAEVPC